MPQIKIEISSDAKVKIETSGFKGKSCKDATAEVEKALGVTTKDAPTREMYEQPLLKNRS